MPALLLDTALDAVLDTLKLCPFLYLTIFFMEWLEHRAGERMQASIRKADTFGPLLGAGLGLVPQCGFSVACAQFYNGGLISAGTLISIFLSTSDEAVPLLISHITEVPAMLALLAVKVAAAILFGYAVDLIWSRSRQEAYFKVQGRQHVCEVSEGASIGEIALEALKRCLSIVAFVFLFSLLTGIFIALVGRDRLSSLLLPGPLAPFLCALVGFIPNCAASVLLTELYLDGIISFGACAAGLCTAAGAGLLVFLRGKHRPWLVITMLSVLYGAAVLTGTVLQLLL